MFGDGVEDVVPLENVVLAWCTVNVRYGVALYLDVLLLETGDALMGYVLLLLGHVRCGGVSVFFGVLAYWYG